jgi:primosomal replication protein N
MLKDKCNIAVQWDGGQKCWTVQSMDSKNYTIQPMGHEIFVHKAGFIAKIKEENGVLKFKINDNEIEIKV